MIYFDISAAVQKRAGLGRYAESVARELVSMAGDRLAFFCHDSPPITLPAGLDGVPLRHVPVGFRRWVVFVLLAHLTGVSLDRLLPGGRLYHATEHLLLPLRRIPTVMTVHDLFFQEAAYHKWTNRFYLKMAMRLFCRRVSHCIAVSQYTGDALMESYRIPRQRITVVHEAAAPHFLPQDDDRIQEVRRRYGLPSRYILFVGTIEPRKNLPSLLQAFERCHGQGLTDGLVIVGRRGWMSDSFFRALERSPARQAVLFPGRVADEDLPPLYSGAQVFVYPSFAEGFGLPVLEAMSCATPVVCSNTTSLPEVAGDAALLVDPADTGALTDAVGRLLRQPELAALLRRRGRERARSFSWRRAARETLAVYESVLRSGGKEDPP